MLRSPRFFVAGDVSELVAYHKVVVYEPVFKRAECPFLPCLLDLRYKPWHGGEHDGHALSVGFNTQGSGNVHLACSGIAVQDEVPSLPDEVERPQQRQGGACVIGEFVDNEVAQISELRKVGTLYQGPAAVVGTHFKLVQHHDGHEVLHAT